MQPSIRVLILFFGSWPEWIDLFFETARRNSGTDFLVVTDCEADQFAASNIEVRSTSFEDYVKWAAGRLGLPFAPPTAYKLCDLRPMLGALHQEDFSGYDFYGWSDVDLLFGDIRAWYSDDILARFDVLSTHGSRISGHFALFRNTRRNRRMYRKIYQWRRRLLEGVFVGLDESGLTNAYVMTVVDKLNEKFGWHVENAATRLLTQRRRRRMYLVEQYTTPFVPWPWLDSTVAGAQPGEWFYRDGRITNSRDDRDFIYLHLMNFTSSRWRSDVATAPWEALENVCRATPSDMVHGIVIDNQGIAPVAGTP